MTTLNLQVGAGGDDVMAWAGSNFSNNSSGRNIGTSGGSKFEGASRFTGVSGLSGATISAATYSDWCDGSDAGNPQTSIYAEKSATPAQVTSYADFVARTLTTAFVNFDFPDLGTGGAFNVSGDISTVIQELADSYNPSAIQIFHMNRHALSGDHYTNEATYEESTAHAAKLDITYTAGGGSTIPVPQGPYQSVQNLSNW